MTKVLDSWALLCYLEREPGFEKIIDLFTKAVDSSQPLFMCVVNWGEVYYQVARRWGEPRAREIERVIQTLPIKVIEADQDLTREAARFKAVHKMSYADCFAAALARLRKSELVTGDREFKAVEKEIKILWL
ncbi:MAG: type II toxin-antitoxin system VapC family toxin [Proteobacteria bacterium]|nr:type II toxin-antitoxin system VapC family toxin [Pseudomonadota bacterium]